MSASEEPASRVVEIFTDGACSGNPGPGGWGAVLRYGAHERELMGAESPTTNNRMEMLAAYQKVRPLGRAELDALPALSRGAAMRFLLTRLYDWLNTPAGAMVKRKDPLEYERKLRFHAGIRGVADYGIKLS